MELSKKLWKRLKIVESFTDKQFGMYPGDWWDSAEKQHTRLLEMGYVQRFIPQNSVHKDRAVITCSGRKKLKSEPPKE